MNVEEIMTREVISIEGNETVLEAVQLMTKKGVGCLLVLKNSDAVGIITERDILKKVISVNKDPSILKVEEIMTTPLEVIDPLASIDEAIDVMVKSKIKKLPVVTEKNELVGMLTATDIVTNEPKYLQKIAELIIKPIRGVSG